MGIQQMFPKIFIKIRDVLMEWKVYLTRSNSYIVIMNSAMIIFLLLAKLQELGVNITITQYYIPICGVSLILMLLFGWIDVKLGFFKEEKRRTSSRNPYFLNLTAKVEKIHERLDKIENIR